MKNFMYGEDEEEKENIIAFKSFIFEITKLTSYLNTIISIKSH